MDKNIRRATVCFLVKSGQVNLPLKKLKIGAGFRNGYGGKTQQGETAKTCAVRETLEESRVKTWEQDLGEMALLRCFVESATGESLRYIIHVFQTDFWLGEPKETPEMGPPKWFPTSDLPLNEFMPDKRFWLPRFFRDRKPLVVTALYKSGQIILECNPVIEEVEVLPEE